jgi:uncharacterized membrane protein YtjA (UPF0391 family)
LAENGNGRRVHQLMCSGGFNPDRARRCVRSNNTYFRRHATIYSPMSPAHPGTVYARDCAGLKGGTVLYYALVFLVIALIAGLLGVSGVASVATNIAYVLFVIAIVLFLVHLLSGRRTLVP